MLVRDFTLMIFQMILDSALIFSNALLVNLISMAIDAIVVIILGAYTVEVIRGNTKEFCEALSAAAETGEQDSDCNPLKTLLLSNQANGYLFTCVNIWCKFVLIAIYIGCTGGFERLRSDLNNADQMDQ